MSIVQLAMTSVMGFDADPIARTLPSTFNLDGNDFAWGTITGAYPFTGTSSVITQSLGVVGDISINLWFKPKVNGVSILSELDRSDISGYHYSMLEITGIGQLRGRIWDGTGNTQVSAFTTVNLNVWNHVYLSYSSGTVSISLNGNTPSATSMTRSGPSQSYISIGLYDSTYMTTSTTYRGKFNDLRISTAGAPSNFSSTRSYYGV